MDDPSLTSSEKNYVISTILKVAEDLGMDLGILKLGVNSKGTATVSEFNAGTDIKNVHLVLVPEKEIKDELAKIKFTKVVEPLKEA